MEDFSLNLLCRTDPHLLSSTLDSLKPQTGSFEIVLLDGEGSEKLEELPFRYKELNLRIEKAKGASLAQMMNIGVFRSHGKYIQFLQPGERYISQYGLSFLKELIEKEPPLISARGVSPEIRSHWILRKTILDLGGFDEHLSFRPMFDLLCRFEKKGIQPLICSRALIDSRKEGIGSIFETCKILYRHFGLKYTAGWLMEGRAGTLRRFQSFLKKAFWHHPDF